MTSDGPEITPELLLRAYAAGIFPMAESAGSDELHWYDPTMRGILPLDRFHVPRSLRKTVRRSPFEVRTDTAFRAVVEACGAPAPERESTWINGRIVDLYTELLRRGFAHSVECWREGRLVGLPIEGLRVNWVLASPRAQSPTPQSLRLQTFLEDVLRSAQGMTDWRLDASLLRAFHAP